MINTFKFNRTPLDDLVAELSDEDRTQILMDGDNFDITGTTGDSLLRQKAREFKDRLTLNSFSNFDSTYMIMLVASCHKFNSIVAIEAAMHLDALDK
jgi:hypothetical protein